MNWKIERHEVLPSTSDEATARIRAFRAEAGQVILAERQTAGRGRRGRRWLDGSGALLFSVVLPAPQTHLNWAALTAAVAVARGLHGCSAAAGLKWPNDVLLGNRKVAGILVEIPAGRLAAVGIGVNVNNSIPSDQIDGVSATSLREHLGRETDREAVLANILDALAEVWFLLAIGQVGAVRSFWAKYDLTPGRRVRLPDGSEGTALGVDECAALRVRRDAGDEQLLQIDQVVFLT